MSYPLEMMADRRTEVSVAAETARKVHFLLWYGDYTDMVWNVLRRISRLSDTPLLDSVVSFDADLDVGGEDQDAEELPGALRPRQTPRRLIDLLNNREEGDSNWRPYGKVGNQGIRVAEQALPQQQSSRYPFPDIAHDAGDITTPRNKPASEVRHNNRLTVAFQNIFLPFFVLLDRLASGIIRCHMYLKKADGPANNWLDLISNIWALQDNFTSHICFFKKIKSQVFTTRLVLLIRAPVFDPTIRSLFLWPVVPRYYPIESSKRRRRPNKEW